MLQLRSDAAKLKKKKSFPENIKLIQVVLNLQQQQKEKRKILYFYSFKI